MSERPKTKHQNTDFSAARARLKDIGEGLGGVFDTMSKLIEEAASQDSAKSPRGRVKSSFDMRISSLDDLSAAKHSPSAARSARVKPRQAERQNAEPEKPKSPKPLAAELHETNDTLVVVVTLGAVAGDTLSVREDAGALVLDAPNWSHRLLASQGALEGIDISRVQRMERNGFLTLYFERPGTPTTLTNETQE